MREFWVAAGLLAVGCLSFILSLWFGAIPVKDAVLAGLTMLFVAMGAAAAGVGVGHLLAGRLVEARIGPLVATLQRAITAAIKDDDIIHNDRMSIVERDTAARKIWLVSPDLHRDFRPMERDAVETNPYVASNIEGKRVHYVFIVPENTQLHNRLAKAKKLKPDGWEFYMVPESNWETLPYTYGDTIFYDPLPDLSVSERRITSAYIELPRDRDRWLKLNSDQIDDWINRLVKTVPALRDY